MQAIMFNVILLNFAISFLFAQGPRIQQSEAKPSREQLKAAKAELVERKCGQ